MLEAIYNAVIVKPVEEEETSYGGIIVPDLGSEKNKLAEVVAVGPGYYSATGTLVETILKVGDIVVLPTMGFSKMEYEGEEYWLGPENQVLAKIVK
jgi:chaperonin GroES|uniref:Co-chaperonin GroES n=1 Tax=uncultured virus TaxID=340016 RepID=A0A221S3E2_9VIRU|nr:co-chaperonin GroES [uncultured virus]